MNQDHAIIDELDGNVTIRIDDWELFDFIDDYLIKHDLVYDGFTEEIVAKRPIYIMHFPVNFDAIRLKEVMSSIDAQEIQRIWKINN